jgi:hypothetical protein
MVNYSWQVAIIEKRDRIFQIIGWITYAEAERCDNLCDVRVSPRIFLYVIYQCPVQTEYKKNGYYIDIYLVA